ncbi:MAG: hypothetical protein EB059_06060 [Alphaproteobacteria bacterium]|nr:hypothetical protein [Alphaproteobacteria bacterium]
MKQSIQTRFNHQAGIAIGPILFVVAILAILATAIAAGSSTFATNASSETNRTNAGAIVQIGETLKLGVDRIVGLGTPITDVVIAPANVSNTVDLFSQTGGGLVPPSTALAAAPTTDTWIYSWANVASLGTNALERMAYLKVTSGVCDQINAIAANIPAATPSAGLDLGANVTANITAWPTELAGKISGCVRNLNTTTPGVWFFQVLAVQ